MASSQVANEYSCWEERNAQTGASLDEIEYPSLSGEPGPKTPKTSTKKAPQKPTTRPRSQREKRESSLSKDEADLINSCFAGNNYVETRKISAKKERDRTSRRQKALHALSDKEKLQERLVKTRMCKSVLNKVSCPHGESCRFAHSKDELTVPICLFDRDCRFVEFCEDGAVKNHGSRPCRQKHTGEDDAQYARRIGQLTSKHPAPKPPTAPMIPRQLIPRQLQLNKAPEAPGKDQLPRKAPSDPALMAACEDPETVLRVPIELAQVAMEAAIKAGNTRIRVEILKPIEVGQWQ
jgi:hypothetical protein